MARPSQPWFRESKGTWYIKAEPEAEGVSVGEVLTAFLADCEARIKPKTMHDYNAFLNAFAERFGKAKASALTTAQAEAYARKPTWSASSQHDFLGVLASAFAWAERTRLIDRTPLVGLRKPPKASGGAQSVVSAETVKQLLAMPTKSFRHWCDSSGSPDAVSQREGA